MLRKVARPHVPVKAQVLLRSRHGDNGQGDRGEGGGEGIPTVAERRGRRHVSTLAWASSAD